MLKFSTHNERQIRHLTQSEKLEESEDPVLVRMTLLSISACIIGFVCWASFTNVNEVARTPGEIVPQGFQQTVQHLEGGIVKQILAQEGQAVDAGQILMVLDGNGAQEDMRRATAHQAALELQKERLRAFIEKRDPDFKQFSRTAEPKMIQDQQSMFNAMMDARAQDKGIIRDQISQKRETLRVLEARQETVARNLVVAQDIYERRRSLHADGYMSQTSFLQSQKDVNELRGESAELDAQKAEARSALAEYSRRLSSLGADGQDDAYRQLEAAENELALNSEIVAKARERVARLEVRAPVRGLVKGLAVNTVGAVVQPGQVLAEIVPLDKPLMAEVRIPPRHIGHIHPGQSVQLKVSAYDFSRYGALPGTLEAVSPSTFEGPGGERFYKGRVLLDHAYVGKVSGQSPLMPGMTVMADIVTGDKTIMDYLLKPIAVNLKTAFTER